MTTNRARESDARDEQQGVRQYACPPPLSAAAFWSRAGSALFRHLAAFPAWGAVSGAPSPGVTVAEDFFGINVMTTRDPAGDDYLVERLRDLGIRHVRLQYDYLAPDNCVERLRGRLAAEGLRVLLVLSPPPEEAARLGHCAASDHRWTSFVRETCSRLAGETEAFEVGCAVNRRRWSGFHHRAYIRAWQLAAANAGPVRLAGPNISDFEPLYNIILLDAMQRSGRLPDVHTDNLFVERVIEPERFDHRFGGRLMGDRLQLNLIGKARFLANLSSRFGVTATWCTYTCWNSRRLIRFAGTPELKKADYLVRFLVLAAASGALERVYWGPLVGFRDGLIDDGTGAYPPDERVACYKPLSASPSAFRILPAYRALRETVRMLRGATTVATHQDSRGSHAFLFRKPGGDHVCVTWTRDRQAGPLGLLLDPREAARCRFADCQGQALPAPPAAVNESPLFIDRPAAEGPFPPGAIKEPPAALLQQALFVDVPGCRLLPFTDGKERGALAVEMGQDPAERRAALRRLLDADIAPAAILRDKRNRVWTARDPARPERRLVIKHIRARGLKRWVRFARPGKARRQWDRACEMIRRGAMTPQPRAFFEAARRSATADSYYICDHVPEAWSARQAFNAFRQGASSFQELARHATLEIVVDYVWNMHWHKIIHGDLSAGNLLLRRGANGGVEALTIDIGRARIARRRLSARERMLDLMRLCHPLDWPARRELLALYYARLERRVTLLTFTPFLYYDLKHVIKRYLQPLRRKRKERAT